MATIKALEGRTVHQIQSGQVIVDLCSVVKELVENSLDAGATSIEVRFKSHGLDAIEVQDNGLGIMADNYETIALKHCTSKLSSYDDLSSLQTFGFRGEALSSLCALSKFHITTAREDEAPKGTRLDFEVSGKLKSTQVVASQKGTTVVVEDIFRKLPVRRRELEKNIKREYGKALGILQAYACISTQARLSVSNVLAKGKKAIAFATRSSLNTRDNIANVFGAKLLPGLVTMDLSFEMQPTRTYSQLSDPKNKRVRVLGHVSRPTFGEGRQAPDRQMFFVNARPCVLPQIAKIFNEVYKSYNVSQSPFVFANFILDTELFERQDQSVPVSQRLQQRLPSFKQLTVHNGKLDTSQSTIPPSGQKSESSPHQSEASSGDESQITERGRQGDEADQDSGSTSLIESFVGRESRNRSEEPVVGEIKDAGAQGLSKDKQKLVNKLAREADVGDYTIKESNDKNDSAGLTGAVRGQSAAVNDFNERIAEQQPASKASPINPDDLEPQRDQLGSSKIGKLPSSGIIQNAFDRMRPRRNVPEVATITVGSKTMTSTLGFSPSINLAKDTARASPVISQVYDRHTPETKFSSSLRSFAAPGSELTKTVGKPNSKSRISLKHLRHSSDDPDPTASGSDDGSSDHEVDNEPQAPSDYEDNEHRSLPPQDGESDLDYIDEDEKKAVEEAKVAELIRQAEESSAMPSQDNKHRAYQILKGVGQKDFTTGLVQVIDTSISRIAAQLEALTSLIDQSLEPCREPTLGSSGSNADASPEERLSLTVSKSDFSTMHIIGQFNLGFILATRNNTDLFIIDQHASDEKYNFERLQATTVVQNQRLVQPRSLQLTAIEEEIIYEHNEAFLKNGFLIDTDTSDDVTVGQRCKLISLPMSREVIFDVTDLEELITLLSDSPTSSSSLGNVPRPSKVRRMFAMRACRSSVMVGKTLTLKQMRALVRKMGEIDKPWNCPHGRPTMRHVCGLEGWDGWQEGDGLVGLEEEREEVDWGGWVASMRNRGAMEGGGNEDEADDADDADELEEPGDEDDREVSEGSEPDE
ncbi:ATP-binding mismatch repair protein [Lecanora helva]